MPTGYTADLYDGKETNFKDFVLNCSRAFGALAALRDDPNQEIPEELKVSDHYYTQIESDKKMVQYWTNISDEDLEAKLLEEKRASLESNYSSSVSRQELKVRYDAMLEEVKAWTPPTDEHLNLKKFMIEQLESSIEADCHLYYDLEDIKSQLDKPIVVDDLNQHRIEKLNNAVESLNYSLKSLNKQERWIAEKNKWILDLRNSLS